MHRILAPRVALLATLAVGLPLSGLAADATPAANAPAAAPALRRIVSVPRSSTPEIMPASEDALNALQRMKVPEGLEMKLWAAEPMLANPVAFNIDEKGRVFVSETYRYRIGGTLDIRDYMWMLEDDLAFRTVDGRQSFLEKTFGPEGIRDLSIATEVVRLVEDTNGDGIADKSSVYAEGFATPLDGIASGVLARRGDVWFTNMPSIWKFSGKDKAETRDEVSRGYGVRYSFTGHDLHGPTFGPDGKIYFSFGDRGASVKTKEGTTIDSPDTGAVFRMNPDGTHMELVADGMRNPQSLLFTENGDLFTGDNDSDQVDEERLVHVVEGGDSGWRVGYQHNPLNPVEVRGPWVAERMWQPRNEAQPSFMIPPIVNIEDGPSGVAYYPGTGLNPSYAGTIFITHFKGGLARSGINTYNVKPAGAGYDIVDSKPFLTSALPTDVRFGPDGRMYISDWIDGYPQPKRGRIYTIADPVVVNDPIVKETQQILGGDWTKRTPDELAKLLAHPDIRVRQEAQFTLAERGEASIPVLAKVVSTPAPAAVELGNPANVGAFARRHAIWGLGQIAQKTSQPLVLSTTLAMAGGQLAAKDSPALAPLRVALRDADPEVRAQAIKVLGDHRQVDQADNFIAALKDADARVKFFAAQSLGKIAVAQPALGTRILPALFDALRANNDADVYIRHAAVMGLVGTKNTAALAAMSTDASRPARMGALLALRRLDSPEVARFLNDSDKMIVREAALAINDRPINAAMPALAALISDARFSTRNAAGEIVSDEPVLYRAINANFRLGQAANAAALAKFAARTDVSNKMRAEAITQLGLWANPPVRDRIMGVYRPLAAVAAGSPGSGLVSNSPRDPGAAKTALTPLLPQLLAADAPAPIQNATIAAVERLEIAAAADTLLTVLRDDNQPVQNRISALNTLDKIHDPRLSDAVHVASDSSAATLRLAALPIVARLSPQAAAPVLENLIEKGTPQEQKAALETLGTLNHPTADTIFTAQLKLLAEGKVAPAAQLEVVEGAAKRDNAQVKALLDSYNVALAANPDPLAMYGYALQGGDRLRGQSIFENQPVLACVRCHRVGNGSGGDAGPNLADIGTRATREYLLEAIVKPSAKIAAGFDAVILTTKAGTTAAGIIAAETADSISLRDMEGKTVEVKKADIAQRNGAPSAMPDIYTAVLSKSDLRDVVEYLASIGVPQGRGGRGPAVAGRGPAPAGAAGGRGAGPGGAGLGRGGAGTPPPLRALRGIQTATTAPAAPAAPVPGSEH